MRFGRCGSIFALLASTFGVLAATDAGTAGAAAPVISPPVLSTPTAGVPTALAVAVADHGGAPVQLTTTVAFAEPVVQDLHDDGLAGDAAAGDGTYAGALPAVPAGTLVRYKVTVGGATWPAKDGKRRLAGFVVGRPAVATQLPVLDWYLAPADAQWLADNRDSNTYVPAVLVVGGEVIDGVEVRNQGGFSNRFSPKPHFKFKLPGAVRVAAPLFDQPVDEFVADADREDPTTTIGIIAHDLMEAAGAPARMAATARVERNGSFFGVYQLYEELDGTWVDRLGFPLESMYQAENGIAHLVDDGDLARLQQRWGEEHGDGTYADLQELVAAIDGAAGPARAAAVADRFDVPRTVDALAMTSLLQLYDIVGNNLQLLHDADSGRWRVFPNDLDKGLGLEPTRVGFAPMLLASGTVDLLRDPEVAEAVLRRMRTLADAHVTDAIADRAAQAVQRMAPDLALDRAAWDLGPTTPAQGLAALAAWVDEDQATVEAWTDLGLLPEPQASTAGAVVSELRAGGDDADFVELANPSPTTSVDLSGWRLAGAVDAVLPGGSVIAADRRIVVPVDPRVVAARGEGTFVAGALDGPLPGSGTVALVDPAGTTRDVVTWSTGGGWPDPAGSGRSLEARSLGGGRATGAGWALSPQPGGTPGQRGASAAGLEVSVWPQAQVVGDERVETRIVVTNHGPGPATDVTVRGLGAGCALDLGALAAGASAVRWCQVATTVPADALFQPQRLAAVAASAQQPTGTTSSAMVVAVSALGDLEGPALEQVRMGAGRLDLVVDPTVTGGPFETWRVEAVVAPTGPAPVSGSTLAEVSGASGASEASVALPAGTRARIGIDVRMEMGAGLASELGPPVTARPSARWPFAGDAQMVDRWYRDLLGRPPTAAEASTWQAALADGGDPADVVAALLARDRWQLAVDPLVRLYLAHFGRVPDPSGLRYWTGRRRAGTSLSRISDQFAGSGEFARRYQGLSARDFVASVYVNVFGRPPDPGGLAYWTGRVLGGTPRGAVVLQFSESPEGIRLKAGTVEPTVVWFALHGSLPTAEWTAMASAWLDGGGDLGTVIESARSDDSYAVAVG